LVTISSERPASDFKSFISTYKERVFSTLVGHIPSWGDEFDDMVRCYVNRQGQYRRPSYLLLWTLMFGGDINEAILPAAAQQASEDWILMHDDWMDSNSLRRGGPTAHMIFGDRFSINAADALHVINWKMVTDAAQELGGERGRDYFAKFYDIILETTRGQYIDLRLTHRVKDITQFTAEDYYRSIHAKSAYYSVYGPMQCGAIVAGVHEDYINRIPEFGIPAGYSFQITDDVLDCTSTEETLGKSIGNDIRDGTKTLILWHAVQVSRNASDGSLSRLVDIYSKRRDQKTESNVKEVLSIFEKSKSIDFAKEQAEKLANEALRKFNEVSRDVPEGNLKDLARDSIAHTVNRLK